MIVDQLFDNKKNINESLADEFMAMAKAKGWATEPVLEDEEDQSIPF